MGLAFLPLEKAACAETCECCITYPHAAFDSFRTWIRGIARSAMTGRNVTECWVVSSGVVRIPHAQGAYMWMTNQRTVVPCGAVLQLLLLHLHHAHAFPPSLEEIQPSQHCVFCSRYREWCF